MSIIDRIKHVFKGADAPTEADSPRDGLLSYASEYHALTIGLALGAGFGLEGIAMAAAVAFGLEGANRIKNGFVIAELRKEPWYGVGGALIGYAVAYGLGYNPISLLKYLPVVL